MNVLCFQGSANCTTRLVEIQELLDEPTLKVREVHEFRWLSVYLAVQTVYMSRFTDMIFTDMI